MKLPNGLSIVLGAAVYAALTAIAGELPANMEGWIPLAASMVVAGIAKAVQVWMQTQRTTTLAHTGSKARQWLLN